MKTGSHRALIYFAIVLGWSSCFWLLSPVLAPSESPASSIFFLIGGAGPLLGALILVHGFESKAAQIAFWLRIIDPRLLGLRWLAISLLLHPILVALALVLAGENLVDMLRMPEGGLGALLGLAFFIFWFGPLPEEIGWRGYALDKMQPAFGALAASVVIGVVWALWHLPLFFVPDTFQHELGFGSLRFWIFSATLIPLSIIMTWVFNHTTRSTLSAALIHFSGNMAGALVEKSTEVALLEFVLLAIVAVGIVTIKGAGVFSDPSYPSERLER